MAIDILKLHNKLMKRKSYRESTPMTRELKMRRAIAYRKKKEDKKLKKLI